MVNGAHAPVSSQVSVSATADSRGFQGAIPRSPEFLRPHAMIQYPYQTKAIVHAAQFNSSFPSYDGVSWAKTESASRTTEKMLFVVTAASGAASEEGRCHA